MKNPSPARRLSFERLFAPSVMTGLLLLALPAVQAATQVWTGSTDAIWEDANWSAAVPGSGDIAAWNASSTGNLGITLNGNVSVLGLQVTSPSGDVSLTGNTLTIGTSGINMGNATANLTIASNLTIGPGVQTWNVATGYTLDLTGTTFTRSTGAALVINKSTNTGTVAAANITNTNGIIGPWAIVYSSGNASNDTAAGYNFATVSGGDIIAYTGASGNTTFGWASGGNNTVNYDVSGVGSSLGVARVANTVRYTGAAGTQNYGSNNTTAVTLNGLMNAGTGTLTLSQTGGTSFGQVAIGTNNNNELDLIAASADLVIAIPVINTGSNVGSVLVVGPGNVTLSGVNTYTGATTIASGTLTLGGTGTLGSGSYAANILNNGTFNYASSATQTLSGAVSGTGAVNVTGTGVLILSGANTYSGATTVSGGLLDLQNSSAQSGNTTITVGSGGGLILGVGNGYTTANVDTLLSGGSLTGITYGGSTVGIDTTAGSVTYATNITGTTGFAKAGANTLTLTGANTYTGNTTILGGTLVVSALGGGTYAGAIANAGNFNYSGTGNQTLSGVISGAGGFTVSSGNVTLAGNNTFTGNVTVNGTLIANYGPNVSGTNGRAYGALGNEQTSGKTVTINNGGTVSFTIGNVLGSGGSTAAQAPAMSFIVNAGGTLQTAVASGGGSGNGDANMFGAITLNGGTFTTGNGYSTVYQSAIFLSTITVGGTSASTINTNATNTVANGIMLGGQATGTNTITFNVAQTGASGADLTVSARLVDSVNSSNGGIGGTYASHGALAKTGAGTMELTGANTYTGGTTVTAGTLVAGSASALGAGAVTINGGTLSATINLTGITGFALSSGKWSVSLGSSSISTGGITGSGTFTITGGTLDLSGSSGISYSTTYTILSGLTGSVSGLTITGYDTTDYTANLSTSGVLSFTASAIPEPATYAALAGLSALGLAFWRRRKG